MSRSVKELLKSILFLIIICLITFLFIRFVAQRTNVSGRSMEPTLNDGDALIVNKLSYHFSEPERFDIVVFPFSDDEKTYFIKRIIGLPGELVQITEEGRILIDGEILYEGYGKEVIYEPGRASSPVYLAEDEYFVLGDNRNNSMDSREESVGNIHRDLLIGKAWIRIYPFSEFGVITHQ